MAEDASTDATVMATNKDGELRVAIGLGMLLSRLLLLLLSGHGRGLLLHSQTELAQ